MDRVPLRSRVIAAALVTLTSGALVLGGIATPGAARPQALRAAVAERDGADGALSVMSYNVEGLPAPARFSRAASLDEIGARLAALRQLGREPNVVLLQEAFSAPARRIADEAGYPYVAQGPSASEVNDEPPPDAAAALVTQASHLKGEDDGKWVGSGLRILSDYPIVRVDRLAFPQWACAGYDCLANKGALIAWIKVPGSVHPVAFIDTHLNSRAASGVSKERADRAYEFQVEALRRFIARAVPSEAVAFLGGDFNSGRAQDRQADLKPGLLPRSRNSLRDALAGAKVILASDEGDAHAILQRAKDWLFYRGTAQLRVTLTGFDVPFGHETDGSTLSDHLGYEAHYRVRVA